MMVEVDVAMVVVKGWVFVIGHLWVCVCGGEGCRVGDRGWVLLFVVVLWVWFMVVVGMGE